jgi:hypothetical protein
MRMRVIDCWIEEAEARRIRLIFASGECQLAGISAEPDSQRRDRLGKSSPEKNAATVEELSNFCSANGAVMTPETRYARGGVALHRPAGELIRDRAQKTHDG